VVVVALAGCQSASTHDCGDGLVCPTELVCTPGGCAATADVASCAGFREGAYCETGEALGACTGGSCRGVAWTATAPVGGSILATTTALEQTDSVAVDVTGHLFIAANSRIWRVAADGSITTVAGTGVSGSGGDGGPATTAQLAQPTSVVVDRLGRLIIADFSNNRVRRVGVDGTMTTVAGTGQANYGGDGGPAQAAKLSQPRAVAVDGLGRIVIADLGNNRVRLVDVDGTISTLAGTGEIAYGGDGGPAAAAQLSNPSGVVLDLQGRIVIADTGNNRVRRIELDGTITTIAGTGVGDEGGDGGPATAADLHNPLGLAIDAQGNLFVADTGNACVRRIAVDGTITTVVGIGDGIHGYDGDGGPATSALLGSPTSVATDGAGNLWISDAGNDHVRHVDPAGTITTVAGQLARGTVDGTPALAAPLDGIAGMVVDASGRLVLADADASQIVRVEPDGTITTLAGTVSGFGGDGGPAIAAQLAKPYALAIDSAGGLIIGDGNNNRVRRIDAAGTVSSEM